MLFLKHYAAITKHKGLVMWYIIKFCAHLLWRGVIHDLSKYRDEEAVGFSLNLKRLNSVKYSSAEYQVMIKERGSLAKAVDHHHRVNRHHPEYHRDGIRDMDMFDIVEMLCDWVASARASKHGNVFASIKSGEYRFDMPPELSLIFKNTTKEARKIKNERT